MRILPRIGRPLTVHGASLLVTVVLAMTMAPGCSEKQSDGDDKKSKVADKTERREVAKLSTYKDKAGKVSSVSFYNGPVDKKAIEEIKDYDQLTEVVFLECEPIAKDALAAIPELKSVTTLEISRCPLGDEALEHLAKLPNLQSLILRNTKVTGSGLSSLKACKKLDKLLLGGESFQHDSMGTLAELSQIRTLELDVAVPLRKLTGLKGLSNLELLDVSDSKISDNDLAKLPVLPHLLEIRFRAYSISDNGITHLVRFPTLQRLDLTEAPITNAALSDIARMTSLERLNLRGCRMITDAGLAHLAKLPKISYLNLEQSGVTGDGLVHLTDVKSLKHLVVGVRQVRRDKADAWRKAVPGRKVEFVISE